MKAERDYFRTLGNAELVKLVIDEVPGAPDALAERFTPMLLPFLIRIIRNKDAAEEVLQITWLHVLLLLSHGGYTERGHFAEWIRTIAFNQAEEYRRAQKRNQMRLAGIKEYIVADLKSKELTPIHEGLLIKAISKLSNQQQLIANLFFIKHLTLAEIAIQLNMTYKAVTSALTKAKQRLRKMKLAGA